MLNKKDLFLLSALLALLVMPLSVLAEKPLSKGVEPKQKRQEVKKEPKQQIKQQIKQNLGAQAKITQGQITVISGSSLIVSKDGKTYMVNTDSKTQYRRHFWGKLSFPEMSVGDKVNVLGKFTDDAKTAILARMIRNTSIQKRKGVFFGTVTTKTDTSLVISTKRGNETVIFDGSTKFVNRKEKSMTAAQINVGDKIRVKGLWDKTLSKITEVTQLKDFSQPVQAMPTPTP